MFFELYDSNKQNIHAKFINRCFQNKRVESPSIRRCTIVIMIYFHINALPIRLFWIQGQIFELNDKFFFVYVYVSTFETFTSKLCTTSSS